MGLIPPWEWGSEREGLRVCVCEREKHGPKNGIVCVLQVLMQLLVIIAEMKLEEIGEI